MTQARKIRRHLVNTDSPLEIMFNLGGWKIIRTQLKKKIYDKIVIEIELPHTDRKVRKDKDNA
jgi:hypothetical protein